MSNPKILKDTSDWLTNSGIFRTLTTNYNVPWKEGYVSPYQSDLNIRYNISGEDLDLDYYANRSQHKIISPLVEAILGDDETLSSAKLNKLASVIYSKYHENWDRLFYAFSLEYNPLQNYNGDEDETINNEVSGTETNSLSKSETVLNTGTQQNTGSVQNTGTQTNAQTGTDTTTETLNNTETITHGKSISDTITHGKTNNSIEYGKKSTENKVYGFNSKSAVNSSESDETVGDNSSAHGYHNNTTEGGTTKDVNTESGTTSTAHGGTITTGVKHGLTDTRTDNLSESHTDTRTDNLSQALTGTETNNGTKSEEGETIRHNHREGNLGITTSQQMLTSEIDMRLAYNLFDVVYSDVDKIMVLNNFGVEHL